MFDVLAIGAQLIDFACLSTDEDGYPTLAAQPGGAPEARTAAYYKKRPCAELVRLAAEICAGL